MGLRVSLLTYCGDAGTRHNIYSIDCYLYTPGVAHRTHSYSYDRTRKYSKLITVCLAPAVYVEYKCSPEESGRAWTHPSGRDRAVGRKAARFNDIPAHSVFHEARMLQLFSSPDWASPEPRVFSLRVSRRGE